jgi:putative DNA primase/helicase
MTNKIGALRKQLQERFKATTKGKIEITLTAAPPTYPARDAMPVEEARAKVAADFKQWLQEAEEWWQRNPPGEEPVDDDPFERYARDTLDEEEDPTPAHAQRSPTGVGKTKIGAKEIAAYRKARREDGDNGPLATLPFGYFGPTLRLNESTAGEFRESDLTAKGYRGRFALDPDVPGNAERPEAQQQLMCLTPERVKQALAWHQSVQESCCKKGKQECEYFNTCAFQKQLRGSQPDVWLAAHEMLYHDQKALKNLAGIIVDESFSQDGIHAEDAREPLTLGEITPPDLNYFTAQDETRHRIRLVKLLREHPLGGLQRERFIDKIDQGDCIDGGRQEWKIFGRLKLTPNMTEAEIEKVKEIIPECIRARRMVGVWGALHEMLASGWEEYGGRYNPAKGIKVSGRLILARKDGKTVLRVRGVRPILDARKVPTMLLDATLPPTSILEKFFPQVQVVSDVQVEMPHVCVRQILGAPTSETKLWGDVREREQNPDTGLGNRKAVRRYVLKRWLEIDGEQRWLESGRQRQPLVVICQKKYHEWLADSGLPEGIALEHYNAIAGLDKHKDVRCLILIGRVIARPTAVEAIAGALTGAEPLKEGPTGRWYGKISRRIRMTNGMSVEVENCDQHVDPMGEVVRYEICEAEMIQAVGRGRGVNRTAETPLDVDILADVVLDLSVDEVVRWEEPSEVIEMLARDAATATEPISSRNCEHFPRGALSLLPVQGFVIGAPGSDQCARRQALLGLHTRRPKAPLVGTKADYRSLQCAESLSKTSQRRVLVLVANRSQAVCRLHRRSHATILALRFDASTRVPVAIRPFWRD